MNRLSVITTRTGDDGTTGLGDGSRISKDDIQIEAIGDIDELNSTIGILISSLDTQEIIQKLSNIQKDLFDLGGEICMLPNNFELLKQDSLQQLDNWIIEDNKNLPRLKEFILPGGCLASSYAHLARCVCRRAERHIITLSKSKVVRKEIIQYLNRLSDWLFIIARLINQSKNIPDVLWRN